MLTKSNGIKISRLKRDVKDFTSDKEYSCIYAINIQTNSNEYVAFLYMQTKTNYFFYVFLSVQITNGKTFSHPSKSLTVHTALITYRC